VAENLRTASNVFLEMLGHHGLCAQQIMQGHKADNLAFQTIQHHDELRVRRWA
jgi:hypothetical protein